MVFTTRCPQGFIPQTPCDNDENGLSALVAVFEANALEEKKNSKQAPMRTNNNNKRRKLMSPDNVILEDEEDPVASAPQRNASPSATTLTTMPAVINEERQKIGQLVCRALHDKYDEHNRIRNTARAYGPKIKEFKLYCRTFYDNDAMLTYQVTRGKVESCLMYNFFREAKPRGKRKGVPKGAPQLDYEPANEIMKVYQFAKVKQTKSKIILFGTPCVQAIHKVGP